MSGPSENEVVRLWQSLLTADGMITEDGSPVKVIYPGRPGDGHGADFRDALILRNGVTATGDIEIHVRSSHWSSHSHHLDPFYNGVILHVVWRHDTEGATPLQNGGRAPVIALSRYAARAPPAGTGPPQRGQRPPCHLALQPCTPDAIARMLDAAGEERFFTKSTRFRSALKQMAPGQALYEGIMEALGYTKNVVPFRELARRLPLETLQNAARTGRGEKVYREVTNLLLKASGMGTERKPSQLPAGPASRQDWDTSGVRPQNSPVRRLMALGRLLLRYRRTGLLEGLLAAVREAPEKGGHRNLEEALTVTEPGRGARAFAILGKERAATIVINVLLPFSHAWSAAKGEPGMANKALDLYRRYPARAANSIERHMCRQLALEGKTVNSASRQQGLIHIFKDRCTKGGCGRCSPVS